MAKVAKNNKSILLEGVEVFYHEKSDTLNIVCTDPDLPKGEFFMKVREGTPTDISLRNLFSRKTGNTKPLGNDLTSDLPQETVTLTDIEMSRKYGRDTFPIGLTEDRESVTFEINKTDSPTNILISGVPGVGKTVVTEQIIRKAEISGIPVLKWTAAGHKRSQFKASFDKEAFTAELECLFSGDRDVTEPTLVIIDNLEQYLGPSLGYVGESLDVNNYHEVVAWRAAVAELVRLLRLSRSNNVVFVMTEKRPTHSLMEMIGPFLTMNIVGHLETVSSAIMLGTNDAVKMKTGTFIIKTGNETKTIKAYHPAMKSDWV